MGVPFGGNVIRIPGVSTTNSSAVKAVIKGWNISIDVLV
jgi:hypothetical protein